MDWNAEALMALRTVIAALLGGLIGWEREQHGREAGIRTYAAVALGACVFGLVSSHVTGATDPTRIAAGVVTGVGFLGAGVILREQGRVAGLTTAATIWATASVGLAVAYGMYVLGVLATLIIFALLALHHLPAWHKVKGNSEAQHRQKEKHHDR
jgi:putative Mg2+ transporter-C (MgtC) family protein